jgi:hypothetical protein
MQNTCKYISKTSDLKFVFYQNNIHIVSALKDIETESDSNDEEEKQSESDSENEEDAPEIIKSRRTVKARV